MKRVVSVGSSYFPLLESFVDKWCSKNGEELKKNFVFSPTVNLTLHMCNNRFQARFFWYIGIRWALLLLQIVRFRALCRHMSVRWWNFCKKISCVISWFSFSFNAVPMKSMQIWAALYALTIRFHFQESAVAMSAV